ncbi:MAG: hypothetical protein LBB21_00190 [Holosporaceae bacterium]|jgi:hypothetical protein|nr:hypothetical protein [Holosporaceae bacterium]
MRALCGYDYRLVGRKMSEEQKYVTSFLQKEFTVAGISSNNFRTYSKNVGLDAWTLAKQRINECISILRTIGEEVPKENTLCLMIAIEGLILELHRLLPLRVIKDPKERYIENVIIKTIEIWAMMLVKNWNNLNKDW